MNISDINVTNIQNNELRKFGITVAGIFLLIGLYQSYMINSSAIWPWICCATILLPSMIYPGSLKLFYKFWTILGFALGWVNSKIILGIIFIFLLTPISLIMKLIGKDTLKLKINKNINTYREEKSDEPCKVNFRRTY